jgi:hypothetical protein
MKPLTALRSRSQSLDRKDHSAVCLHGEKQAGTNRLAVEKNRTAAAYSLFAAQMSPGKAKLIAQEISERHPRLSDCLVAFFVDRDRDGVFRRHNIRLVWQS